MIYFDAAPSFLSARAESAAKSINVIKKPFDLVKQRGN